MNKTLSTFVRKVAIGVVNFRQATPSTPPAFMSIHNSVLKVVIVHEALVTGIEAAAQLRRLAARLDAEFGIKSGDWQINSGFLKFETLRDPELREQATAEAIEADMIIISVASAELPVGVRNWIESVLSMKEGGPAAVVALLDPGHKSSAAPPRLGAGLRRLAEQCGLDFFCSTEGHQPCVEPGMESIVSHSESSSADWEKPPPELLPAVRRRH